MDTFKGMCEKLAASKLQRLQLFQETILGKTGLGLANVGESYFSDPDSLLEASQTIQVLNKMKNYSAGEAEAYLEGAIESLALTSIREIKASKRNAAAIKLAMLVDLLQDIRNCSDYQRRK